MLILIFSLPPPPLQRGKDILLQWIVQFCGKGIFFSVQFMKYETQTVLNNIEYKLCQTEIGMNW